MPLPSFIIRRASLAMRQKLLAVIVGYFTAVVLVVMGFALLKQIFPSLVPDLVRGERPDTNFLIIAFVISFFSAAVGGYVMAFVVKHPDMRLASYLGLVIILINVLTIILEGFVKPLWWYRTLIIFLVPFTMLGASLYRNSKSK